MHYRRVPGALFWRSRLFFLLVLLTGCSGLNDPYPTLIPTTAVEVTATSAPTNVPPTDTQIVLSTFTPIPSDTPKPPTLRVVASLISTTRPASTAVTTPILPPTFAGTPTLPPVRATLAQGITSITITTAQLNNALKEAWRSDMALDYPPVVEFSDGLIVTDMRIKMKLIKLKLSLTMVSTTKGNVLDLRAVSINNTDGLTTTQIKQGQALVQTMIEWLIYQAAGTVQLNYSGVSIASNTITITLLTD